MALTDKLAAIGDALRAKTGTDNLYTLDAMPAAIAAIQTSDADEYAGVYEVTPRTYEQTLDTSDKVLDSDIVIKRIPFAEADNAAGGTTITIG